MLVPWIRNSFKKSARHFADWRGAKAKEYLWYFEPEQQSQAVKGPATFESYYGSRGLPHGRRNRRDQGFTLVELMVAVFIVAVLAAIAVPALSGDNLESDFDQFTRQFAQDVVRARMEAAAQREDRGINLLSTGKEYRLVSILPGTGTVATLRRVQAPTGVSIAGALGCAAAPGSGCGGFGGSGGLGTNIVMSGIGDVSHNIGQAMGAGGATVYFVGKSDGEVRHTARLVIFQTTGYSRLFSTW